MSVNQNTLRREKRRVIERLEALGAGPVVGMYRKPSEPIYFLEVEVPNDRAADLLQDLGPLLDGILMEQDFMIAVLPLPPGTKAARQALQVSTVS